MDRLYVSGKDGDRELANIQDSMNMGEQSLSRYIDTSDEELQKAIKDENVLIDWNGKTDTQHKQRVRGG